MARKIIIDTDPGIDDAYALAYALNNPGFEVLGLTSAFGNVTAVQAAKNARFLCHLFGRDDIPVAVGSEKPFKRPPNPPADFVHGKDGLGNTFEVEDIGSTHSLDAADFIIETARKHQGDVTLVCIAPLSNIAIALEREPELAHWVKEVVIMGGAISANGNVNPAAEANILNDPEAAEKVFYANWPISLFPLDMTDRGEMPSDMLETFAQSNPVAQYLYRISQFYLDFYRANKHIDGRPVHGMVAHDLYPLSYLLHPEWYTLHAGACYVHTKDDPLLGSVVMDRRIRWSHPPHHWTGKTGMQVCFDADYDTIFEDFNAVVKSYETSVKKLESLLEGLTT